MRFPIAISAAALIGVAIAACSGGQSSNTASNWQTGFLAAGASGVVAGLAWTFCFRFEPHASRPARAQPTSGGRESTVQEVAQLFRRPVICGYLAVLTADVLVSNVGLNVVPVYLKIERRFDFATVVVIVAAPITIMIVSQLMCGVWSDARLRGIGSVGAARQPFITIGAVLSSLIAILPYVGTTPLGIGLVLILIATGFAMTSSISVLGLDLVPRRLHGRFFGVVLALSMVGTVAGYLVGFVLAAHLRSNAGFFIVAGTASLLCAPIAWLAFRHATPIDDGPDHIAAIGRVFQ